MSTAKKGKTLSMTPSAVRRRRERAAARRRDQLRAQSLAALAVDVEKMGSALDQAPAPQPETRLSIATNGLKECNRRLTGLCASLCGIADSQLGATEVAYPVLALCGPGKLGDLDQEVDAFVALLDMLDATTVRLAQV